MSNLQQPTYNARLEALALEAEAQAELEGLDEEARAQAEWEAEMAADYAASGGYDG